MVVTVPELPRYLSAPDSTYNTPPLVGLVVGVVVELAIPITFTPLPNWSAVPIPTLPLEEKVTTSEEVAIVIVPPLIDKGRYALFALFLEAKTLYTFAPSSKQEINPPPAVVF